MPPFEKLYETATGWAHWCSPCGEVHIVPKSWMFNGNMESPTFSPSVKHTGKQAIMERGRWTGKFKHGADGAALDWCCHYFIRDGKIEYCDDCTHELSGATLSLGVFDREII